MEVEAKEGGTLEESLPVKNAIAQPLKVSNELPHPCRKCTKRESVQEDGPDAGVVFSCGVMVENMELGVRSFYCPWFNPEPEEAFTTVEEQDNGRLVCKSPGTTCQCSKQENSCGKVIAAIIEAEKAQEALRAKQIVEELGRRMKALRPAQRPVIIAEETLVSPHEWMDEAIARVNREQRTIKSVLRDEDKKGCFGAFGYHGYVLPCVWEPRCKQSQEDY